VPQAPVPRGYAPYGGQVPPGPGPSFPAQPSPAPVAKPQQTTPILGAIALGLGILLLIIGASASLPIVVIGGLVAGAWGIWRLVTASGNSTNRSGPNGNGASGNGPPPPGPS
jgi:hypothetical protein